MWYLNWSVRIAAVSFFVTPEFVERINQLLRHALYLSKLIIRIIADFFLRAPNKTSSYRAHCNGPTTTPPTRFELWWNFIGFGRSQVFEGESVRGGHLND